MLSPFKERKSINLNIYTQLTQTGNKLTVYINIKQYKKIQVLLFRLFLKTTYNLDPPALRSADDPEASVWFLLFGRITAETCFVFRTVCLQQN